LQYAKQIRIACGNIGFSACSSFGKKCAHNFCFTKAACHLLCASRLHLAQVTSTESENAACVCSKNMRSHALGQVIACRKMMWCTSSARAKEECMPVEHVEQGQKTTPDATIKEKMTGALLGSLVYMYFIRFVRLVLGSRSKKHRRLRQVFSMFLYSATTSHTIITSQGSSPLAHSLISSMWQRAGPPDSA